MLLEPFTFPEVERLLWDPAVAGLSAAAVESIRADDATPFGATIDRLAGGPEGDGALRKATFAAAVQGLSPRIAALPGASSLPPALGERLAREAELCGARGRVLLERLGEALALLEAEGIAVVALKGAALLLRGEAGPSLRPMADLDLLLDGDAAVRKATALLSRRTPYRLLLDTPRHAVLAERDERVPSPAAEHPGNPLRIELHRSFRLPVLGVALDATEELRRDAVRVPGGRVPSDAAMLRHLWHHAAEDFAARGLRGIQAVDFLDRARRRGPLVLEPRPGDAAAVLPLLYAADALERLFPGVLEPQAHAALAAGAPGARRARAAALSPLRHARPARGHTKTALSLAPTRAARLRLLARSAFPTLGEVKANVAPEANGVGLLAAWGRVLLRRSAGLLR